VTAGHAAATFILLMSASRTRRNLLFAGTVCVLATVVAVAAIAVPIYVADDAANKTKACEHEYTTVQASLNAYMAINNLSTLPASASTSDMTTPVPLYEKIATATNPSYVPNSQTTWLYAWTGEGKITSITARPDGPTIPNGCVVYG
jgi:hypothetical protein